MTATAPADPGTIARQALARLRGQPPKKPQIDMVDEQGQMLMSVKTHAALDLVVGACRYLAPATGAHAVLFLNDSYVTDNVERYDADPRSLTQRFRAGDPHVQEAILISVKTRTSEALITQPYRRVGKIIAYIEIEDAFSHGVTPPQGEPPVGTGFAGWISDGLNEALQVDPAPGDQDLLVRGLAMVSHEQGPNVSLTVAPQLRAAVAEAQRRMKAEAGTWAAVEREKELVAEAFAYEQRMRERHSR